MDYTCCTLCPRMCKADRTASSGYCGCPDHILAARAALHHWEEPCISGTSNDQGGSGAVFFPAAPCGAVSARTIPSAAAALALP